MQKIVFVPVGFQIERQLFTTMGATWELRAAVDDEGDRAVCQGMFRQDEHGMKFDIFAICLISIFYALPLHYFVIFLLYTYNCMYVPSKK